MLNDLVIYAVMGLFVFQTLFYTLSIHRLINKVMARNYGDYIDSKRKGKKPIIETKIIEAEPQDQMGRIADLR